MDERWLSTSIIECGALPVESNETDSEACPDIIYCLGSGMFVNSTLVKY